MSPAQVSQRFLSKDPGRRATFRSVRCSDSQMRRGFALLIALFAVFAALFPAAGFAAPSDDQALQKALNVQMRAAGPYSGAYVLNATDRATLFKWKPDTARVLASNTKLFTAAGGLDSLGPSGTLSTAGLGSGALGEGGTWGGGLYLRGSGDPTFGSSSFVKRNYATGATADELADEISARGITSVSGRVYGDESRFDSLRGGPDSGYGTSIWVGPLSALSFNRGLANDRGSAFPGNPPAFAAARLDALLEARGVSVRSKPAAGVAPSDAAALATVESPPASDLVRDMLKPSDNFFAEMLVKTLAPAPASTSSGTRAAALHASALGARVQMADGSGLSRADK